jgi:hypothetical protein
MDVSLTCAVSGECQMLCVRRRIRRPSQHDGTVVAPATGRRVRDVVSPETLLATCCSRRPPSCRRCRTILGVRDHGPWPVGRSERVRARLSCREPDRCAGGKASPRTSTRAPNTDLSISMSQVERVSGRRSSQDCGCKRLRTEDRVCARCGSQGSRSGPRKRLSASRIGPFLPRRASLNVRPKRSA